MPLSAGTRLGPYEIVSALGAGGMGEVYRAHDTKLRRDVALKILPDAFATDPERLARFQREAQVLASLNHSHIGAIYGLEESNGIRALVLELVEGPTLADRIAQGAIPLDEALPIARQIAEALEAAHEQGVIHRDLKPANIKLRPDGVVKVLDFGLARLAEAPAASGAVGPSQSPTITTPAMMTGVGMILGTAAYMSPEQAKGRPSDKRSDVWAFGSVLYEMLTGKRAFKGEDVSDTLAAVLRDEPDGTALPADTPPAIRRLLRRSLEKDHKRRLPDIAVARIEIDEALSTGNVEPAIAPGALRTRERLAWISIVGLVTLVALAIAAWAFRPVPPPALEMRLEINTPPTTTPTSLAISPDGQKLVFAGTDQGRSGLWLRSMNAVSARALAGTEGASFPFWSPDSRSLGFFADAQLKRIDIEEGRVQILANASSPAGGTWNQDGTILFVPADIGPIFRISATGSVPTAVDRIDAKQTGHTFPQFLPDGRHFLYYVAGNPEVRGVYIGEIGGTDTRRVLDAESAATYTSVGYLLFVRQGTLYAQRLDLGQMALRGSPIAVAERVAVTGTPARGFVAAVSASAAGAIAYRVGSVIENPRRLTWFDRSGQEIGIAADAANSAVGPALSPDGHRVALSRTLNGGTGIWLLDLGRGVLSRFTFATAVDTQPIWSPDGRRIAFASNRTGVLDLYEKSASGVGSEQLLLATDQGKVPNDWSPDGRFLLYRSFDPKTGWDLWALPFGGDRKPIPVVQTNFEERDGQFSPDGRWVAYQSNESGRYEIYVQPFPGPAGKSQISKDGGAQVRWRPDGKELFYIALDDRLMAVPIHFTSDDQGVDADAAVPLFSTHVGGAVQSPSRQQYSVSPDGQRFLMNTVTEEAVSSPITVILNWTAGIKK
jgi:Tol biopolymer transport system component